MYALIKNNDTYDRTHNYTHALFIKYLIFKCTAINIGRIIIMEKYSPFATKSVKSIKILSHKILFVTTMPTYYYLNVSWLRRIKCWIFLTTRNHTIITVYLQ